MNQTPPISQSPRKSSTWLWVVLIVVVLILAGYLGWLLSNKNKSATTTPAIPTPTASLSSSPAADLNSVDKDLSNLDSNFNQLDKIDSSQDETPTL